MVSANKVDHGEDGSARGQGSEGVDVGNRVPVIFGDGVKPPVIPTGAPAPIWLRDDVEGRSPRRGRWANYSHSQHLLKLRLRHRQLLAVQGKEIRPQDWTRYSSQNKRMAHSQVVEVEVDILGAERRDLGAVRRDEGPQGPRGRGKRETDTSAPLSMR